MSLVAARVAEILVNTLGVEPEAVTSDVLLQDGGLGADSLDAVEIMVDVEDEFGIEIPAGAEDAIVTVGDLVRLVETHLRKVPVQS